MRTADRQLLKVFWNGLTENKLWRMQNGYAIPADARVESALSLAAAEASHNNATQAYRCCS